MKTENSIKGSYTSPIQAPSSGSGNSPFFAAIIYNGNQQQLSATLLSVLKQKISGIQLNVHIFHPQQNIPDTTLSDVIKLVSFRNKQDFFLKFTQAIENSEAIYCITLLAGEELFEGAFDSAERIFGRHQQVNWLTGIQTFRAKAGFNVTLSTTAMRRWSYNIYERNLYKNAGRYIPPASTFWRKSIWPSVSREVHFVELKGFCEDLWLALFKTQTLYTCKVYFSTSDNYKTLNAEKLKLPNNYALIEDSMLGKLKEFLFINNIPYLRLFYRNQSKLAPVIRFDHTTQSYYLSEY